MKKTNFYNSILNWLKSTEMFFRPSKQLPGRWSLMEYYYETDEGLHNIPEIQLRTLGEFWEIEFTNEKRFSQKNNLKVPLIESIKNGFWSLSQNYISLNPAEGLTGCIKFQFAVEGEKLKILNKDKSGKIVFFGFFKKN